MKTIKQIADEIGVSKQAVSYRLKQLEKENDHQKLAVKENGVLVVSLVGESLIKSAFSEKDRQIVTTKEPPKDRQKDDDILAVLKATIDTLQEQLAVKDKQLNEALAANKALSQSINAGQHNELAGTIQQQLTSGSESGVAGSAPPTKAKTFWQRLFGGRNE